jgi:hypothetical protein
VKKVPWTNTLAYFSAVPVMIFLTFATDSKDIKTFIFIADGAAK